MKLALLDRDGVLNHNTPEGIRTPAELKVFPFAGEAVHLLNEAGYKVAIVTNQSNIGRGIVTEETLKKIHEKLVTTLHDGLGRVDLILFAPDHPDHATERRKPGPGMLLEAMSHYHTYPEHAVMVGDSAIDMQAAHRAGVEKKFLVRTGNGAATERTGLPPSVGAVHVVDNLLVAAKKIVGKA
ncbi:MAG: HAD-IIIA family hydrolase [Proteobacteria bacterium]|nr:HAD-IIIA family hydrolase [Pseudomonadota bacterium]